MNLLANKKYTDRLARGARRGGVRAGASFRRVARGCSGLVLLLRLELDDISHRGGAASQGIELNEA